MECPYHHAVVVAYESAEDMLHAVLSNPGAWWTYLQFQLKHLNTVIFIAGSAAPALLSGVQGYGVIDGQRINACPSNRTNVAVLGWMQEDVNASVSTAESFGLTVVATLRMSDNTLTEL